MQTMKPNLLPPGNYPGFAKLKSQPGVHRCKLWPNAEKKNPGHADYRGKLFIDGKPYTAFVWVHADGSLGLRLGHAMAL